MEDRSSRTSDTPSKHVRRALALTVTENVRICDEHYRLVMRCPPEIGARPGQFLQLRCGQWSDQGEQDRAEAIDENQWGGASLRWAGGPVLLPRPFSLAGVRTVDGQTEVDILYRVVGPGTTWMSGLRAGDTVAALGPLGNGFDVPSDRPRAYLVGGGVGLPPMIWLAECLRAAGHDVVAFCGAKTGRLTALTLAGAPSTDPTEARMTAEEFARHGTPVILTTDDGSLGVKGLVNSAMEAYHAAHPSANDRLIVYTCGPEPMMRAVAHWCLDRGIRCQVCMERMMACGIGTCQSCVVAIQDASAPAGYVYKLCCADGPVFDARDVVWDQPVPRAAYTPPY